MLTQKKGNIVFTRFSMSDLEYIYILHTYLVFDKSIDFFQMISKY